CFFPCSRCFRLPSPLFATVAASAASSSSCSASSVVPSSAAPSSSNSLGTPSNSVLLPTLKPQRGVVVCEHLLRAGGGRGRVHERGGGGLFLPKVRLLVPSSSLLPSSHLHVWLPVEFQFRFNLRLGEKS
ncbi:hypothetical protein DFH08DRAFT_1081147, partial [Mycena albidolilacea]